MTGDEAVGRDADVPQSNVDDDLRQPHGATDAVERSPHRSLVPPVVLRGVLLVLGLSVVAWLVWRAGPAVVWRLLLNLRWRFAAVTGLYITYLGIRALALWRIVPTSLRYREALRIRLSGDTIENLTFTGPFFSEPTKGWLLTRSGLTTEQAFAAIATDYFLYDVVTGCLSAIAVITLLTLGLLPPVVRPVAFGLLGITGAVLTAFVYVAVSGTGVIAPLIRLSVPIIGCRAATAAEKVGRIEHVLVHFLRCRRRAVAQVMAIDSLSQVLLMLEIYVVLTALVAATRWWHPPVIEGAAKYISLAFAFVPGQVGAAEGVYAFLTGMLGLTTTAGLTLALVRRIRSLIAASIGMAALAVLGSATPAKSLNPESD